LSANYSYQNSVDEASNTDAGYAPHHHLYLRAESPLASNVLASIQVNWVADRRRAAGDPRAAVADYKTVDLSLRTVAKLHKWGFAAAIRNLFDARVLEPSLAPGTALPDDLPLPGRSFYLQATYAF
jgi:iron complex outermembrane receptor protein